MTRNKPWRGDAPSTAAQTDGRTGTPTAEHNVATSVAVNAQATPATQSTQEASSSTQSEQGRNVQTSISNITKATTGADAAADSNLSPSVNAKEQEPNATTQLAYVAPTVADEDNEDTLHVYHPQDDDFIESPIEDPAEVVPDNASASDTASTEQRNQEYNRDTHEGFEEDEDLLTALGNLMSGAPRGSGAGPFGFLDVMASALSDALPRAFLPEDHGRQPEQHRSVPVSGDHERPRASSPARGHFHASSSGISLEEQRYLVAQCKDIRGTPRRSRLDLNDCLSNDNGRFRWSKGGNFKASARNVELVEGGQMLKAQLRGCNGRWRDATVHLPHRITNKNGQLALLT